ncbi:MAG: creatininase family protein [Gemmatimonadota bacterium]|nr:creatininase family protein [Gemmatimonadota bacterium]
MNYEVAILPWGATEPHNLHLPFGTDSIQAESIAAETARLSWEAGARVVVLPTIPLGANAQQLSTPLTLNLDPSTQARILEDIVGSLEHHSVPKLVILNGHGGNDFRQMIRELQSRTEVFLCAANWYTVVDPTSYFDIPGDHAGELETSIMLHVSSHLVLPLTEAGDGRAKVFKVRGLREGIAWAPRDWAQVTADTGVGDPSAASSEKGSRFFTAVTERLAAFVTELAEADVRHMYEPPADEGSAPPHGESVHE